MAEPHSVRDAQMSDRYSTCGMSPWLCRLSQMGCPMAEPHSVRDVPMPDLYITGGLPHG